MTDHPADINHYEELVETTDDLVTRVDSFGNLTFVNKMSSYSRTIKIDRLKDDFHTGQSDQIGKIGSHAGKRSSKR